MKINGIIYDPRRHADTDQLRLPQSQLQTKWFASQLLEAPVTIAHFNGKIYEIGDAIHRRGQLVTAQTVSKALDGKAAGKIAGVHIDKLGRVHVSIEMRDGLLTPAQAHRMGLSLTHTISQPGDIIRPVEVALTSDPARKGCSITDTCDHDTYVAKVAMSDTVPRDPATGKFVSKDEAAAAGSIPATPMAPDMSAMFNTFLAQYNKSSATPQPAVQQPVAPPDAAPTPAETAAAVAAVSVADIIRGLPPAQSDVLLASYERIEEQLKQKSEAERLKLEKELAALQEANKSLQQATSNLQLDADLKSHLINDLVDTLDPPAEERAKLLQSMSDGLQGPGALAILACTNKLQKMQRMQEARLEVGAGPPQVDARMARLARLGLTEDTGMTAASGGMRSHPDSDDAPAAKRPYVPVLAERNVDMYEMLYPGAPKPPVYY